MKEDSSVYRDKPKGPGYFDYMSRNGYGVGSRYNPPGGADTDPKYYPDYSNNVGGPYGANGASGYPQQHVSGTLKQLFNLIRKFTLVDILLRILFG